MNHRRILCLATCLNALASAGCNNSPPPLADGTISVITTVPANLQISPSVLVLDTEGDVLTTVTTTGTQPVPVLPGTFTIQAQDVPLDGSDYGGTLSSSTVTVASGQTVTVTVNYVAVSGAIDLVVAAPFGGSMPSGAVTNSSGTVVQTIAMLGETLLTNLLPDSYTITANSVGDNEVRYDPTISGSPVTVTAGQTSMASITYAVGPVLVADPSSISLSVGATPAMLTFSETNYSGTFTESDTCASGGVATVTMTSAGVYSVTASASGTCTITGTDSFGQVARVTVTVPEAA